MRLFGRSPEPQHKVRAFTAAATKIDLTDPDAARREASRQRKRPLEWQRQAWNYHDELLEVRGPARWMGDAQARMRLFPAVFDPNDPQAQPVAAEQASWVRPEEVRAALDIFDRFRNPDDERPELQRILGLNLFVAGEVWLVGTDENEQAITPSNPTGEMWRPFSVEEVCATSDGRWYIEPWEGAMDGEREYLDLETATLLRCYRRHGRRREYPDSPMRSANLVCEELLAATQAILGSLRSRLAAGILPIPDDIEDDNETDEDEESADDGLDPVLRKLLKHFAAAKKDPRSAASLVPFLLRVPGDIIDKLKVIDVARAFPKEELDLIEQLTDRLAVAMDVPTEQAAGTKGQQNHWNVFELDEDGVRMYVEPYTSLYVNPIVSRIWRPRLEMAGVANPELWTIGWDPTDVMSHPDMSDAAIKGYEANPPIVSGLTTAKALGFSEEEMPDDAELASIIEWRARTATSVGGARVSPNAGPDQPAAEPPPRDNTQPAPGEGGPQAATPADWRASAEAGAVSAAAVIEEAEQVLDAALVAAGTPAPSRLGQRWARIESKLARDTIVAADAAVQRMLERAQNRIVSAAAKAPLGPTDTDKRLGTSIRAQAKGLRRELLAAALGPDQVRALGLSDDDLFGDQLDSLHTSWLAWLGVARADALRAIIRAGGTPSPIAEAEWESDAQVHADESWVLLQGGLAALAASLLFAPAGAMTPDVGEFDSTVSVPPRLIREALSAAGGGASSHSDRLLGYLGGADFEALIEATPELEATGWLWEAGAPSRPFEPHQDLDGTEFDSWTDEQLAATPDEWPNVSYYAPDDHDGCQCTAVPNATLAPQEA